MLETETRPVKPVVIGFDRTQHLNIAEADRPFIKAFIQVYIYDPSVGVHCCELTPSYELLHLYDTLILNEPPKDMSDDEFRDLNGRLDADYCYEPSEPFEYHHCRSIERLIQAKHPYLYQSTSEFDSMDEAEERYRCNPPF